MNETSHQEYSIVDKKSKISNNEKSKTLAHIDTNQFIELKKIKRRLTINNIQIFIELSEHDKE